MVLQYYNDQTIPPKVHNFNNLAIPEFMVMTHKHVEAWYWASIH